jgi:hypothetical protein
MTKVWQCGVQAGNEEWRHREPRHKYRMKQNVQRKDEKKDNWGKKMSQKHNGSQQFPNGCAKIIMGGTQEVSLEVVPDE